MVLSRKAKETAVPANVFKNTRLSTLVILFTIIWLDIDFKITINTSKHNYTEGVFSFAYKV